MSSAKTFRIATILLASLLLTGAVSPLSSAQSVSSNPAPATSRQKEQPGSVREIHLFTVEYKTRINGVEKEVYRFDPGTVVVRQGERIRLVIHGFHGKEHHVSIPELDVRGTVRKGQSVALEWTASRPGAYRLICHNHSTEQTEGPMIADLLVIRP
ncbi:cupredoxin domain-containing protein [Staphylospora marina]|uniref:cupredoxin domain-containing protein n=1 Tax=Staphylospora marina TaxID=2490858 RepID=UPI0013DE2813|nr:cupredoxin domain-containing protein [Staphylospora marina]